MNMENKYHLVLEGHRKDVACIWQVNLTTNPHPIPKPTQPIEKNLMEDRTKP